MPLDADRRVSLAATKLQALVTRAFPGVQAAPEPFNAGVGMVDGDQAFVHVVATTPSPMAAVLAWGERAGAAQLHLIVDDADPVLVTQARGLSPAPSIWKVVGTDLVPLDDVVVPDPASPNPAAVAASDVLVDAGCSVVVEHGVVLGEVLGLEVARVVVEPDGTASVRVGVGLFDQEAHAVIHADTSIEDRLANVIGQVRAQRRSGVGPHPLNLVARERWLRQALLDQPARIGADGLEAVPPLAVRTGIREQRPAAARGVRERASVLVVCATGIDLDLVPEAAGQLAIEPVDEIVLVMPAGDHHPIIDRMATRLAAPTSVIAVQPPWSES